ncbi:uncharacterized protein BXZ73DRAFT_47040 [Epithele typhae]|uniref:uncharacterized protein n=1 Tax=Epithele typhae TaxID=378194 RepID=UPI002007F3A8|nr:uncharacterized protein BXZ73DRAFT_47040 [Epithele typhae]KAH9932057.1 hypothetical protein BXZ73DRAFT_47040 [Epithele typhae]
MYFSTGFIVSLVAASSLVSAVPLQRRKTEIMSFASSSTRLDTSGAVYFITNEGDNNQIVAASINTDGTVNLDRATTTDGNGGHGNANGPDALFSQGSVKASSKGKVLATVNAGSNTLSLFSIDAADPTKIDSISNPISSGGEFPVSLAFNKNGDRLCTLNGGAVNGVACFDVDSKKGLQPIANSVRSLNLKLTTPPSGPADTVSHILFSEDEKQVIASVKGSSANKPGFLAVWDVANDGSLSENFKKIDPPSGGGLPFGMSIIPGQNAVLVADPAVGFTIIDLQGNKSSAVKVDGQSAVCWTARSSKTGNFYLTDIGTAIVTEVNVDNNLKGTVVKQYQQTKGSATLDDDVASINGDDFLYVLGANATEVQTLSIQKAGQGKNLDQLDVSGPFKASNINFSRNNLQGMTTFVTQ